MPLTDTTNHQRDDQRVDFRVPVDILLNKYVKGRPYLARASNLSRRGLLVHRIFEPTLVQNDIGLQFQLPGSDRVINCAGRVIHDGTSEGPQGVELVHVDPEHQMLIDNYVMQNIDWP